jgi:hypothetical protein
MDWRRRLRDLGRAGGLVTMTVTLSGCPGGCCNANPDPCCSAPKSVACEAEKVCLAEGGVPTLYPIGDMLYRCDFPHDLGVPDLSTPADLAKPRDLTAAGD